MARSLGYLGAAVAPGNSSLSEESVKHAEKPVVLVVDDEESNRDLCRHALELNGYEVLVAAGPREAVEILSAREIDFVICDISMPHNGQRVYEYLLQNFPQLKNHFLFVTGNPAQKDQVTRLLGAVPCLLKPYPLRVLLDTLKAALGV